MSRQHGPQHAAAVPRLRSLSQETHLMDLSSKKIGEKKHNDKLRNYLFISRVYELAYEEDATQRLQRQRRKRAGYSTAERAGEQDKRGRMEDSSDDDSTEEEMGGLSDPDEDDPMVEHSLGRVLVESRADELQFSAAC